MKKRIWNKSYLLLAIILLFSACVPKLKLSRSERNNLPGAYAQSGDTLNSGKVNWKQYFNDPYLAALIDSALSNNQELNIILREIEISKNEVRTRKGEYLPFVNFKAASGLEKEGRYTRFGALEKNIEIKPGKENPEPFPDFMAGAYATWEIDVWKKLRNAKKAAVLRYLSSVEGKNFMVTHLISEISVSYYELMTLDNLLDILNQNIEIQRNVLQINREEKQAAKVTQLAVNRFEAQLLNTQNRQYEIKQAIVETENRIRFLCGKWSGQVQRNSDNFTSLPLDSVYAGIPSQLLKNRCDIRQAELELAAAKLDVQVARANFFPSFAMTAGAGFKAFNPAYFLLPESILYNLAGDLMAPLVNRNAIKATYSSANAKQIQAVYQYEQTILKAYLEVLNQLSGIENYSNSFRIKSKEVDLLNQSVNISNNLFSSARADYMEVLLTQKEALESKIDLIEIKMKQLEAKVNIYQALGGGWN